MNHWLKLYSETLGLSLARLCVELVTFLGSCFVSVVIPVVTRRAVDCQRAGWHTLAELVIPIDWT